MSEKRESQNIKESLEDAWVRKSAETYDDYLEAMKRAHHAMAEDIIISPRARHRYRVTAEKEKKENRRHSRDVEDLFHISTIASMVPDEIINNHSEYTIRSYETALMFIDVSGISAIAIPKGFTELCEAYTKSAGRGGPSKLTQVLNSYIGAMVQEILTHNGDVLKFAGDAFLSMWKKTHKMTMQDVVHTAIDCGLIIQKNYGTHLVADLGITLKVKVAISAGVSHFSIIGSDMMATYVIVGQPVWDVKAAEYMSHAGDVLTSASAWTYVNEAEYCTQPCGDGRHTKVLGVGDTWKRVEKIDFESTFHYSRAEYTGSMPSANVYGGKSVDFVDQTDAYDNTESTFKEYSLRPAVISALRSSWWPSLRRFMVTPVLRAVDNDEPMDFLTEVRHVVVVFLNIITKTVTESVLIDVVFAAYKQVCSVTLESGGLVNKVSMFDKDMMFLVVFGLRGLKHEDEAQKALLCAHQLKETLQDPNILCVSIGVTSGRTYCGVVGHVLRREYTVIGSSVNKAARLMMAYPNKVTCDKETFVRSKLDLDLFRLMEPKNLKGIAKPGPIYEFNKSGWPERMMFIRHPILGRNEELRTYRRVLQNAVDHQHEDFTRYRDLRYGIIILGPRQVGKRRLAEEFISITPSQIKVLRMILVANDKSPYAFIRLLLQKIYEGSSNTHVRNVRDVFANRIRHSIGMMQITPLQIHALNTIFNLRFPLPENFSYSGDILTERCVKELIEELFNLRSQYLVVVTVEEGQYIDDQSWRILLQVLEVKSVFVVLLINDHDQLSDVAKTCAANNMFVRMQLRGIDRWYHAALACQLLDVQAIPADLEKVLESASGGLPGWIQNFLISLVQRGELTVVTVPRCEAVDAGAVMPLPAMLQRTADEASRDIDIVSTTTSQATPCKMSKDGKITADNENIQMAVLADNYNFDDMKVDMTMDVIILKTYDSLTPFEKMLLKCGSVLGDIFSRRMLLYLLQSDSQRKVAQAVAKLFEIRVLECEGGDFSRDTSMVLIHSAPAPTAAVKPPNCACLGTRAPPNCRDLPLYSFCGYMKFRHSLFRTTTYELLTENQKQEMHARALMYLERYTRRCTSCGAGCFIRLFGIRSDDGLIYESRELRRVRIQIAALSAETRMVSETLSDAGVTSLDNARVHSDLEYEADKARLSQASKRNRKSNAVRSFSSLDLEHCECLPILLSVYNQVIDHCRVVGDCQKLFETYMEYVELSLLTLNTPQAIRLLMDAEKDSKGLACCNSDICKLEWIKDYRVGHILTLRGCCMLESGDLSEARVHLLNAMKLYGCKFPTSRYGVKFCDLQASLQQNCSLYSPNLFKDKSTGWFGQFYDDIARTLNQLYKLFTENTEVENATLAAKWALKFARKSNSTFRILCESYGNMIYEYRLKQNFSKCAKLEKLALDVCNRKRGHLDVTEVYSLCILYTNIFFLYVEQGKKAECLDFGLSIIPLMSSQPDITVGQSLVQWILKLLLTDLRIQEMVMIMREFYYMTDFYDLSSETWYYYYAMVILLDTGYCVESYSSCEKFYIKQGDAVLRVKTPAAAWNFFVCMWLVTLRVGAWERSILWEDKIKQILALNVHSTEYDIMLLVRLVEAFLIALVNEVENRNLKQILILEQHVITIFGHIRRLVRQRPLFKPRYLLMYAYYHQVKVKKSTASKLLNKAHTLAKKYGHITIQIWIEHTREHWKGALNPKLKDYWAQHVEAKKILDYKTFDPENSKIIPYTLPLPRIFNEI